MDSTDKAARGFTLVELMIAITLVSMMMAMAYSSFHLVARGWNAVEDVSDSTDELRIVHSFLYRQLSQARPLFHAEAGKVQLAFQGDTRALRFVAPSPVQRQTAEGLYLYSLHITDENTETRLILNYQPYTPDSEMTSDAGESVVLSRQLNAGGFGYFGQSKGRGEDHWQKNWPDLHRLPKLVRLYFSDSDELPDIVIPLRSGTKL